MLIAKELILYSIISIISFKIFYRYFSGFIVDSAIYRSSHVGEIPTSAGIIFLIIHLIYIILNKNYSLLILAPIGFVGFLDDIFNIKQIYRLFFHSLNIILTCFLLFNFETFNNYQLANGIILFIFLLMGLVLINCINFMDGMDGLVSSNIFLILLNYSLNNNLDLIAIPVVLFVFLFYNWHPAKIFMGDSGSTFLGLVLFYITFSNNDLKSSLILLSTASPLLMDSCICILRRFQNNENIFSPHKKHLYQRLHQKGMSHSKVSILYAACTFILIIFSLTNNLIIMSCLTLIVLLIGIYLERYWAIPFKG